MITFICISGKAQNGKDTIASYINDQLKYTYGKKSVITHNADLLKYICKSYFNWDGSKDEKGRTLLQQVGTSTVRAKEPDFWVNFILKIAEFFPNCWDYIIIPDARFPNELVRIQQEGYSMVHIKVQRDGFDNGLTDEQKNHESETALNNIKPDYTVHNNGTLNDLYANIDEILKNIQEKH